jgi:hypothetical protein
VGLFVEVTRGLFCTFGKELFRNSRYGIPVFKDFVVLTSPSTEFASRIVTGRRSRWLPLRNIHQLSSDFSRGANV